MSSEQSYRNQRQSGSWVLVAIIIVLSLILLCGVGYCGYTVYYVQGGLDASSEVKFYAMKGCGWCDKAKTVLKQYNIAHQMLEYRRGEHAEPPTMPDGKKPESFPTFWVGNRNMGGYERMIDWVPRVYCERKVMQ